jgi:hypothetical protein
MRYPLAVVAMTLAVFFGGSSLYAAEQDGQSEHEQANVEQIAAECEKQAQELGVEDIDAYVDKCVNDNIAGSGTEQS